MLINYLIPFHLSDWAIIDHLYSTAILKFVGKRMQGGRESVAWLSILVKVKLCHTMTIIAPEMLIK